MHIGRSRETRKRRGATHRDPVAEFKTTRRCILRYIDAQVELAGIVAAGEPVEPIPQTEQVEVPKSMVGRGTTFALRVKGTSMRDDGILPGDIVVVQKQSTARNGQTVIALINGEATIKTYHRTARTVELRPANETMQPILVKDTDTFRIEGIVVGVIRHLRK